MAVVKNYMAEEQKRINNQKATTASGNTVGAFNANPVSAQKRQQMTQITQPAAVYTAGQNPGNYVSRYQGALDSILQQINNPDEVRYEFNGDNLFRSYADLYTQYGKQASLDTMGQATALTGGYGNSYAQQAGQQAYQQYLLGLYDKGFDLRNMAYQGYRDQIGDLKDTYNAMMAAEQGDYAKYQNAVNAWQQQQQLDLERERWEMQLAQMMAQDGGAAGGPGPGSSNKKGVYALGNNFFTIGADGKPVMVDINDKNKDQYTYYDQPNDLKNTGNVSAAVANIAMDQKKAAAEAAKKLFGGK